MSNFFAFYDDYVKSTEPPPNFHAWSAMGAISALLGKKCFIPQGHFTVFPNLYIVLVGDPGTRKSTAMNIAKRLVRLVPQVPIAPESSSREAMIDSMADSKVVATMNNKDVSYWQNSAFATEMQEFLGGKHINQAMVGFLTAIWDEPIFKERTRKGGEVIIHNPYFSLLGCCTPEWMNTKLKQDVITDGFSRRTIFALESELNTLNPWPESTPEQIENLAKLEIEVNRIFDITGLFTLTKEAREYYDYRYIHTREESKNFSPKVQNYFSSKHILALKLGMCLSAGIDSRRVISSEVIKLAFKFLEQSERSLDAVFSGVGRNELKAHADRIYARIADAGSKGITQRELLATSYDDVNMIEFNEILEILQKQGRVHVSTGATSQDALTLKATALAKPAPAVPLLKLARRLTSSSEQTLGDSSAFSIARHLDPITERLLTHQKERKDQTASGLLLKGKPRPASESAPQSSEKAASSHGHGSQPLD